MKQKKPSFTSVSIGGSGEDEEEEEKGEQKTFEEKFDLNVEVIGEVRVVRKPRVVPRWSKLALARNGLNTSLL